MNTNKKSITEFTLDPRALEKWMRQNDAHYTGEFFDGCLLDNFIVSTRRGYAAIYEKYVNPNMSIYRVEFSADGGIDLIFSRFIERAAAAAAAE